MIVDQFLKCKKYHISNKESDYVIDLETLDRLLQSHEGFTLLNDKIIYIHSYIQQPTTNYSDSC